MKKHNLKQAKEWFKIGDNELGYAKCAFNDFDDFYAQMCVQAHQAIEKYLKGFLVYHNNRYSLTHDLTKLIKECVKVDSACVQFLDYCNKITDYYIELRYPVHYLNKTKTQAKEAIGIADKIIKHMPLISNFYGISILMFFQEHNPPHFHAKYSGEIGIFNIKTGKGLKKDKNYKQSIL